MTKDEVIDLIRDAGYGTLATTEGTQPKVRPMMPYLTDDGDFLVATFANKRVVSQVKNNPQIELCYIDRRMNFARITGKATISSDQEKKDMVWNNVPMLRQYFSSPNDPGFTLIEIITQTVEASTPQQEHPDVLTLK